jgi:S1-C subfamily serine protease
MAIPSLPGTGFDLSSIRTPQKNDSPEKIKDAASQFEALLIGQILKAAHGESDEGSFGGESDPASASARAGIRRGDVILEINKHPVKNAQEAVDLSAKAESKKSLVKLWSRGSTIFVVVDETDSAKSAS